MIFVSLPLLIAVALLVLGQIVSTCDTPRRARRVAVTAIQVLFAVALLGLLISEFAPPDPTLRGPGALGGGSGSWRALVSCIHLLIAMLAVGLAPVASHPVRTLVGILRLMAIACAFGATEAPLLLAGLWAAGLLVLLRELRASGDGGVRLSGVLWRYHAPSLVLAVVGSLAFLVGWSSTGAICWLVAIAVREALLGAHGWLPLLFSRAPLGLAVAFVAPQSGFYCHVVMLQDVSGSAVAHAFAFLGVATAVIGAMLGCAQTEARRALAWLVISQTGLIAFGLENSSEVGLTGAALSWQVLGLATSGVVMTLAALQARRGLLGLDRPQGSFARTPRMAVSFLFLGFASVGLPFTLGFVAEDLLMQGSVDEFPGFGLALVFATALNGINVLRCFFALFSGTSEHIGERDLTRLEATVLTAVMAALIVGAALAGEIAGISLPDVVKSMGP